MEDFLNPSLLATIGRFLLGLFSKRKPACCCKATFAVIVDCNHWPLGQIASS